LSRLTSKLTKFLICLIIRSLAERKFGRQSAAGTNGQRDGDHGRTVAIATTATTAATVR